MQTLPTFRLSGFAVRLVFGLMLCLGDTAPTAWAQALDSDGDGVADSLDLCTGTPSGRDPMVFGCSPVEALLHVELSIDYGVRGLGRSTTTMRGVEGLESEADRLDRLVEKFWDKTRVQLDAAAFCKASTMARRFSLKLEKSRTTLGRKVESLGRSAQRVPFEIAEPSDADSSPADRRILDLEVARNLVTRSIEDLAAGLANIAPFCSRIQGEVSQVGRVVRIDDSARQIELESGLVMLLGDRAPRGAIYEGADVEVKGVSWGDGTGAASSVVVVGPIARPASFELECMGLRILPRQPLPPYSSGPFVVHSPEGYRPAIWNGDLYLERGMGVTLADFSGCELDDPRSGMYTRLSAQIDKLRYNSSQATVLAADWTEGDDPVRLPDAMSGIRITVRRQLCKNPVLGQPPSCEPPVDVRVIEHNVNLGAVYTPCEKTFYDDTAYEVDDAVPADFDSARVTDVELDFELFGPEDILGGNVQSWEFSAEGYGVTGGVSSWPSTTTISMGEEFAIQNMDREFYDIFALYPFLEEELHGVDRPSGLRWPGVAGTRKTGHPFRYSCPLPSIGRDRIAKCTGVADTYYRFPFEGGAPDWALLQGNNGSFTHMGVFAFDFAAAAGTKILAPRGGLVVAVRDTSTGSCYCEPPACNPGVCQNCTAPNNGNFVAILHQDGSLGRFFHFLPGTGVDVVEGQRVKRGDLLGTVGSTGCSTAPHVHFEVGAAPGEPSIEITFEADISGSETCYLPGTGDPVESTNVENP